MNATLCADSTWPDAPVHSTCTSSPGIVGRKPSSRSAACGRSIWMAPNTSSGIAAHAAGRILDSAGVQMVARGTQLMLYLG